MTEPRMTERVRVLVVEDSPAVLEELERMIQNLPGFELVGHAKDGAEGVQLYDQLKPDVVCMDLVMPKLDGVQAMRFIKQKQPDAKIIVVSSEWPTDEMVAEARRQGATAVLTKPVDVDELRGALRAAASPTYKVMIVEDSESASEELQAVIDGLGHYTVAGRAKDGAEALQLYEQLQPDIVCMDLVMPRLNGVEAIRFLIRAHPDARIIVVSSEWPTSEQVSEAMRLGAKKVVVKPVDAEELRAAFETV